MQQLIRGEHSIRQLGKLINDKGCSSIFLITGKHFTQNNELNFLKGLNVHHWVKQGMNVEEKEIEEAWHFFQDHSCDAITAIGGGSVMDLAKAIIFRCVASGSAIPYFIAAPTTAGSGSEATQFAVIYKERKKVSLENPSLLPATIILDPALTYSLSAYQTAVTGIDALSQAVESFWSKKATDESKQYAAEAITLWKNFYLQAVLQPNELARKNMMEAAWLAGKAINVTRTTGPHALSYYLTAYHQVPHGQAVGFFLPLFFLYNEIQDELLSLLELKNGEEAKNYIQQIMKKAGLHISFSEAGIDKTSIIAALLEQVNEERFANNPTPFNSERLKELILTHL